MISVYCFSIITILLFSYTLNRRYILITFDEANSYLKPLNIGLLLCGLMLFIIHGFRYMNYYGTDEYFYRMASLTPTELTYVEFFNVLIRRMSLYLSGSGVYWFQYGQFYILVMSAIWIVLMMKGIEKNSKDISLSLLIIVGIGFFLSSMNIVRQCVSAAIIFCGYGYLKNNDFRRFLITVILACGFHSSAIIMIPFFFLIQRKGFYKRSPLYLCTIFLVFGIVSVVFSVLLKNSHYSVYFSGLFSSGTSIVRIAFYVIPGIIILIMTNGKNSPSYREKNIAALFIIICILSVENVYIMRINTFLIPMIACIYAELPDCFEGRNRVLARIAFCILLLSFGIVEYGSGVLTEYHNILFYKPDGVLQLTIGS